MPMVNDGVLPGSSGTAFTYSAASGTITLKDPGTSAVGRWLVDIKITVGTAALTPKKRLMVDASVTAHSYQSCWYTNAATNAQVAAATTITANGVYDIDASGCDVALDYTTAGGGIIELFATPLLG